DTPRTDYRPPDLFTPPGSLSSGDTADRLAELEKELRAALTGPVSTHPKGKDVGGDGKIGSKPGPGTRARNPGAPSLTRQQRREMRWRIDFSGDPAEHVRKLKALKITLAVPTSKPGLFLLADLTQTPSMTRLDDLGAHRDKVKWFNSHQPSLQGLMTQLQLPQLPRYAVIFLPDEMEQEMLRLEEQHEGLREDQIELTEFEIRPQGDGYRPVVVRQTRRK